MKLIRIFGIVLALHLVGGLLFFQPGCQSKPQPQAVDTRPKTGDPTPQAEPAFETVESSRPRSAPSRPSISSTPASRTSESSVSESDSILQPLDSWTTPTPASSASAPSGGTYTVKSGDSLWGIANRHGVSLGSLLSANGLTENSVIQPGQELKLPSGASAGSSAAAASKPASRPTPTEGTTTYKVRRGDNLSSIAQRHNTSVSELKSLNGLSSDVIRIDQTLIVPAGGGGGSTPAQRSSSASASSASVSASGATHTVSAGETPGAIATRYGVTVDALMSANNISDPRRMQIGQKLVIPGKERESTTTSSSSTAASRPAPKPEPAPAPAPAPTPPPAPVEENDLFIIPIEEEDDFPIIPILPEN